MKVYSRDLRAKVLKAYNDKEGSMRALAEHFMVSLSFVFTLIKRFNENGHINPKPHGGCRNPAIDEAGCKYLIKLIERNVDLTLEELCSLYEKEFSKKVSKSAMDRTLKKLNITRKKRRCMILKKRASV
ncbi:MAG: transposase [Desulfamplus sp.]|nr:transposase [Desulfamplus sp.]